MGHRRGEEPYKELAINEWDKEQPASFFSKKPEMNEHHMKIIREHNTDMLAQEPPKMDTKWKKFCQFCSQLRRCFKTQERPYENKTDIDEYIDLYWLINCPESASTPEINKAVWDLLHKLFIIGLEKEAHDHPETRFQNTHQDMEQDFINTLNVKKTKFQRQKGMQFAKTRLDENDQWRTQVKKENALQEQIRDYRMKQKKASGRKKYEVGFSASGFKQNSSSRLESLKKEHKPFKHLKGLKKSNSLESFAISSPRKKSLDDSFYGS